MNAREVLVAERARLRSASESAKFAIRDIADPMERVRMRAKHYRLLNAAGEITEQLRLLDLAESRRAKPPQAPHQHLHLDPLLVEQVDEQRSSQWTT